MSQLEMIQKQKKTVKLVNNHDWLLNAIERREKTVKDTLVTFDPMADCPLQSNESKKTAELPLEMNLWTSQMEFLLGENQPDSKV